MLRKNKYLEELGIPQDVYGGNFVRERKFHRFMQRRKYGIDYRDIFNMDASFGEWLYTHMRMYKENSVHDDTYCSVEFEGVKYTIEEAIDRIINASGEFLKCTYNLDIVPHPRDYSDEEEYQIEEEFINSARLFLKIVGYCWL